jgi:hypothetical protein
VAGIMSESRPASSRNKGRDDLGICTLDKSQSFDFCSVLFAASPQHLRLRFACGALYPPPDKEQTL